MDRNELIQTAHESAVSLGAQTSGAQPKHLDHPGHGNDRSR